MRCPICGSDKTRVIESRPHYYGVRRRRECPKCMTAFTTFELILVETIDKNLIKEIVKQ